MNPRVLRQPIQRFIVAIAALSLFGVALRLQATPPFSGTIFIDPEIIVPSDPSAFQRLDDAGHGIRSMFDRRVNNWVSLDAFLFNAGFDDNLRIEVEVNPEFGTMDAARTETLKYLHAIGQLPTSLRLNVQTIWIHQGVHSPLAEETTTC